MKKKIIITSLLGFTTFAAMPVSATEQIAYSLFGDPGYITSCNLCHTNSNINTADKGNLMSAAKSAYNQDKWGLSGLKTFVATSIAPTTPAAPICVSPKILDTATNACVTPVPVCTNGAVLNAAKDACIAPQITCVSPQVLNPAKTACITPAPVVPVCKSTEVLTNNVCVIKPLPPVVSPKCPVGQVLNPAKTACITLTPITPAAINTNPVLNAVAPQWDVKVGELISIPLSVKDAEQDAFMMTGSVVGSKFSAVHPDSANLPSIDFTWIPTATQVNKIFTITFQAKETKTAKRLASNKIPVKFRVWAAGDKTASSITKLSVITSKWAAGKLNLAGNVVLNSLLTAAEKQAFIAQKLDLTVSSSTGVLVGSNTLTLDTKGNWTTVIPATQVPCDIVLQFDGQKAARTVTGCIKTVAATTPAIIANNSMSPFGGENDDNESENENEHHGNEHDD
ncbi:MAG: hypothetical protein QX194_07370 [Methylococcales bacterium]